MPYPGFSDSGGVAPPANIIPQGFNLSVLNAALQNGSVTYEDLLQRARNPQQTILKEEQARSDIGMIPIRRQQEIDVGKQATELGGLRIDTAKEGLKDVLDPTRPIKRAASGSLLQNYYTLFGPNTPLPGTGTDQEVIDAIIARQTQLKQNENAIALRQNFLQKELETYEKFHGVPPMVSGQFDWNAILSKNAAMGPVAEYEKKLAATEQEKTAAKKYYQDNISAALPTLPDGTMDYDAVLAANKALGSGTPMDATARERLASIEAATTTLNELEKILQKPPTSSNPLGQRTEDLQKEYGTNMWTGIVRHMNPLDTGAQAIKDTGVNLGKFISHGVYGKKAETGKDLNPDIVRQIPSIISTAADSKVKIAKLRQMLATAKQAIETQARQAGQRTSLPTVTPAPGAAPLITLPGVTNAPAGGVNAPPAKIVTSMEDFQNVLNDTNIPSGTPIIDPKKNIRYKP